MGRPSNDAVIQEFIDAKGKYMSKLSSTGGTEIDKNELYGGKSLIAYYKDGVLHLRLQQDGYSSTSNKYVTKMEKMLPEGMEVVRFRLTRSGASVVNKEG